MLQCRADGRSLRHSVIEIESDVLRLPRRRVLACIVAALAENVLTPARCFAFGSPWIGPMSIYSYARIFLICSLVLSCVLVLLIVRQKNYRDKTALGMLFSEKLRREICSTYNAMILHDSGGNSAVASFTLNLTDNTCSDFNATNGILLEVSEDMSADAFLAKLSRCFKESGCGEGTKKPLTRGALLKRFADGETSIAREGRCKFGTDRDVWVTLDIAMVGNPLTNTVSALVFVHNINDEKTSRLLLERTAALEYGYMALVDMEDGKLSVISCQTDDAIKNCAEYSDIISYTASCAFTAGGAEEIRSSMDMETVRGELEKSEGYSFSCSVYDENRRVRRKHWFFAYVGPDKCQMSVTRRDITEQYTADIDPLTNLYRREKFFSETGRTIEKNMNTCFAIVRFDIDRFKAYNDLFGIDAGNSLLSDIACKIMSLRGRMSPCVIGRIEADHFAACVPLDKVKVITNELKKIQQNNVVHPEYHLTLRTGIYVVKEEDSLSATMMGERALMALKSIKNSDSKFVACYDESMRQKLITEQKYISQLKEALAKGQFIIYLQPQVNTVTGDLTGAEALARWQHPADGIIMPGDFIPLLEKRGCIMEFDMAIWEKTCALLAKWKREGRKQLPISVNVSRIDMLDTRLSEILRGLVSKYSLEPEMLRLEITESAFIDAPEQIISTVKNLRSLGFFIEMDDFGSGSSSLNTLKDVPTDLLKMDMRFFSHSSDESKSGLIISAVVNMAHWLNIPVIAEGVEERYQAEFLKTIGCVLAQGFLYSKPLPVAEFEEFLEKGNVKDFCAKSVFSVSFANTDFWNPHSINSLLFSAFIGAAGVLEFSYDKLKQVRINDKAYRLFGLDINEPDAKLVFMADGVDVRDRERYRGIVRSVVKKDVEADFELRVRLGKWRKSDKALWFSVYIRPIARRFDSCLLFISAENISRRKAMEERVRVNRDELKGNAD